MIRPESAARVAEIVKSALEREAKGWPDFLQQTCAGDEPLRAEVESLLQFQKQAARFIEQPAIEVAAQALASDPAFISAPSIAGYRIIEKIGEGGMGNVYLAEDEELHREVAVKLVRPGTSTADLVARFRHEEQILAALNHPNIAHLYGGGATRDDTPFFVMEYVAGVRIDDFCRREKLAVEARLQLFRKVCAAVQYAHQRLVIHRDLKPSNLLVTADGEPKLLDFGIAKLLDPRDSPATLAPTLVGVMTPDYASPEQVRGDAITTASDVYSLGVILYELLTESRPYKTKSRRPEEIARAVTEQEPLRPSTIATEHPQAALLHLHSLRGDLDNIILMALRKEPLRRYASVEQFSEDIRRHLEHRPVIARKDRWTYRSAKFIRRNRVGVAAAILLLCTLLGGLVATAWQARIATRERDRAQRRFQDVRQLANALLFDIAPKIERMEGSTEARAALVQRALVYLDSLAHESAGDPQLQAELATAYEKVGELQGSPRRPNLSDYTGAIASYEKARTMRDRLREQNPGDLEQLHLFAEDLSALAAIHWWIGDTSASLEDSESALAAYEKLLATDPNSLELALGRARALIDLANTHYYNERLVEVYAPVRKAIASLDALGSSAADNPERLRLLGRAETTLGMTLSWDGKQTEGETEMTKAVALNEALVARYPNDNVLRQSLLDTYQQSSQLYETVDDARSLAILQNARTLAEASVASDSANQQARQNLAKVYSRLGVISLHLGQSDDAVGYFEKSSQRFAELAVKNPRDGTYKTDQGRVLMYLGETRLQQKKPAAALPFLAQANEIFDALAQADPMHNLAIRKLATVHTCVGEAHQALAKTSTGPARAAHAQTARESFHHALDLFEKLEAKQALNEYDRKEMAAVREAVAQVDQ